MAALIDSNVILDITTQDPEWFDWSADALSTMADEHILVINPIIYAEISIGFKTIETLDAVLSPERFRRDALPWEAGFLAGKCFMQYKQKGGTKHAPMPDFYIGAHAAITAMPLVTRDASRYRHYFPTVTLVTP